MARLDLFIRRPKDAGHTIVQEFPASRVPNLRGVVVQDLAPLLADASSQDSVSNHASRRSPLT
jgi:hypothetical protein